MEVANETVEGVLNYFVEIIKKTQKHGYKKRELISCLLDLHLNALSALEQLGASEEEQIFIKAELYDCYKKREEARLKALLAEKWEESYE